MIKKQLNSMLAKLAVVFIILSCVPVYAQEVPVSDNRADTPAVTAPAEETPAPGDETVSEGETGLPGEGSKTPAPVEETAGSGERIGITKLEIYIYNDKYNPDRITNMYLNDNADPYGYDPSEDAQVPYPDKRYIAFPDATESAPKIRFVAKSNRENAEFEFERLNRSSGSVEYTTGRIAENYYVCEEIGNYRIHVYATDGSGEERIYYTDAHGLDKNPPRVVKVDFCFVGEVKNDWNGYLQYGDGVVTIRGAEDPESGLPEKPYMIGYPDGEWQASNEFRVRTGSYTVAARDRTGNVWTGSVQVLSIDIDPPITTFAQGDTPSSNGYRRTVSMLVIADDATNIPQDYISLDGQNWLTGDCVEISENGVYEVWTRDVFGHVSQNTIEVTNIDREEPHCSWNIEHVSRGGGFSKEEILHVIAFDEKAGLGEDPYSFDGGNTWVSENSLAISENGIYLLRVRDAVGNESDDTAIEVADIDNKRPQIKGISENRMNTSGIYAGSSVITVEAGDDESGLADEPVYFEENGCWSRDRTLTVSRNGIFGVKVKDRVGNIQSSSIKIENIDPAAPEVKITGNPENLTMSKITLTVSAKDQDSGLKSIYISDARAGKKMLLKEYTCDSDGAGEHEDSADVEITSNSEYLFYVTDMCGNEQRESVTVTKITNPKTPSRPEDPGDEDEGGGGSGGYTGGSRSETVEIGKKSAAGTSGKVKNETGITVKNSSVSENSRTEALESTVSSNRYSRNNDTGTGVFEEEETGGLTDAYEGGDFSTDVFESEEEEYFAENSPKELEMIPNPDEIETGSKEGSNAGTIAATVVLMVLALSALTVFLLVKKGLITLPDIFGKNTGQ